MRRDEAGELRDSSVDAWLLWLSATDAPTHYAGEPPTVLAVRNDQRTAAVSLAGVQAARIEESGAEHVGRHGAVKHVGGVAGGVGDQRDLDLLQHVGEASAFRQQSPSKHGRGGPWSSKGRERGRQRGDLRPTDPPSATGADRRNNAMSLSRLKWSKPGWTTAPATVDAAPEFVLSVVMPVCT